MNYLPLIGCSLKSPEVIEFIEVNDLEVTYNFDKINEGTPDEYWCEAKSLGISLKFNEHQILEVVFLYISAKEGFAPANIENSDLMSFSSKQELQMHCEKNGIEFKVGNHNFLGEVHDWIKLLNHNESINYNFMENKLQRITIMAPHILR